jgi:RND family efflux transporter MFP subunit
VSRLYSDSVATLEALQDTRTALDAAKANLEIANFNLQHARIVAPANGRILKRFVEENEMTGPGTPVFYFGSSEASWIIRLGVTDRELVSLSPGDSADITFDAYPGQKFEGTVTEISESVDARSGTFEVEVTLDDTKARLVSGFVARVTIFPAKKSGHLLVPVEALVEARKDSAYIYVLDDGAGQAAKRKVSVGEIIGDQVIILSDLKTTDRVITAGGAYLTGDSKIIQADTN